MEKLELKLRERRQQKVASEKKVELHEIKNFEIVTEEKKKFEAADKLISDLDIQQTDKQKLEDEALTQKKVCRKQILNKENNTVKLD